jgi:nucleotide-binding universal stress UspA family protein
MNTPELNRLLVPLDGSRLAESVLPATEALAVRFGATVTLIHVLEKRSPTTVHGDRHLSNGPEAAAYVDAVATRLRGKGITVEMEVHTAPEEDVANSVVEHAEEFAPDLVILCTHGKPGLRGLLFGSVAQQVLQRGGHSLLLIQPDEHGEGPAFSPRHILVPLDRVHSADGAICMAGVMARGFGAEIDLVSVVPTLKTVPGDRAATAVHLPATTRAILDIDVQGASEYLAGVASQCQGQGTVVKQAVLRGDALSELLQYAVRTQTDLVAMPSHGRAGLGALFAGSIGGRLMSHARRPLLLVPAGA